MFTSVYKKEDIKDISDRISKTFEKDNNLSEIYELQEDIARLSTRLDMQDRLIANLVRRVAQTENPQPLIGI